MDSSDRHDQHDSRGAFTVLVGANRELSGRRVCDYVSEHARRDPAAVAVRGEHTKITYAGLWSASTIVADAIGGEADARYVICMHRTPLLLVAMLGVWRARSHFVPLDPSLPKAELLRIVEAAPTCAVLCDSQTEALFAEASCDVVCLGAPSGAELPSVHLVCSSAREPSATEASGAGPNTAYVIYTSGSTGVPKGVVISHRALLNYLEWAAWHYEADIGSGSVAHSSIGADLSMTGLFVPLLAGKCVSMLQSDDVRHLAAWLKNEAQHSQLSFLKLTPRTLELLGALMLPTELARTARHFVLGGEELRARTIAAAFGTNHGIRVTNEYGPTETTVGSTTYTFITGADSIPKRVPIGRPIWNTSLHLATTPNETGEADLTEIVISGYGVAEGYLGTSDPQAFIHSSGGGRAYRTGDLAYLDANGELVYCGRRTLQTKIHGYRVEPDGVAARLEEIAGVRMVAVVAVERRPGARFLSAFLVREKNADVDLSVVNQWARHNLPSYCQPDRVAFLDTLPLSPAGKLDRRALVALSLENIGASESSAREEDASSDLFDLISRIWSRLLGVDHPQPDDSFFASGGDSITALHFVNDLLESGVRLSIRQVLEERTLRRIVDVARAERQASLRAEESTWAPSQLSLSGLQRAALNAFEDLNGWSIEWRFEVPQSILRERVTSAATRVCFRHPALRTRLRRVGSEWIAESCAQSEVFVEWMDVAEDPGSERTEAFLAKGRNRISLAGPVLGLCVEPRTHGTHITIVANHLVCDVVSLQILAREISAELEAVRHLSTHDDGYLRWLKSDCTRPPVRIRSASTTRRANAHAQVINSHALAQLSRLPLLRPHLTVAVTAEALLRSLEVLPKARDYDAICVEHNGRSNGPQTLQLSRTVGWLTALYQLPLRGLRARQDPLPMIEGLLSYPEPCSDILPPVALNYLGSNGAGAARQVGELVIPRPALARIRPALFEIELVCWLSDDTLRTCWNIASDLIGDHEARALMNAFEDSIHAVVRRCEQAKSPAVHDASLSEDDISKIIDSFS